MNRKIKNALIVHKKTFFEFYFLRKIKKQKEMSFSASEMARFRLMHAEHYKTLDEVERVLKSMDIQYKKTYRKDNIDYRQHDFIVTVGGDGTFLQAARELKKEKILGVNSDPDRSVGRFCGCTKGNFKTIFNQIFSGEKKATSIARLSISSKKHKKIWQAANDVLICDQNPATMSRYVLNANGIKEYQRSSGVWFSTSAGSTGAIRSAGGRAIKLSSEQFLYQPRELYYCKNHKYQLKGGLLNFSYPVFVKSSMDDGVIYFDGAHCCATFRFGDKIRISKSRYPLKVFL
ncbi:MAG: NAD(+)/NADH kinase [Candidatus Omnitrophica bacterium]|nr:NAD(+)/NADH kinase [Candidatus Omnitrophota bacterium]